ncbi:unnamed protein product, partial [marine sediment metagenome]
PGEQGRMRKHCLIVLLILNIAALAVTGSAVCRYLFFSGSKPATDTIINDEAARLSITSIPRDAKVFVNGYYKGRTPADVKIVSVQTNTSFKLVILKEGFLRWEKNIKLHTGDFKEFQAVLKKAR